ncbi:GPP34 family phosphoprotein [Nonomuraea sp. NPDC050556]|uniref:GOLPH3/VPS74 family protein n=1 Tax=Nonomuraea sp. NPDC050556 TaxID=3364369 RepID=UPI00378F2337
MDQLPLYQDLFLVCHHENGKPIIHRSSISLGLAGAVLIDLALAARLALTQGRIAVTDATPTGDPILDASAALPTEDARVWAKKVAATVYDRTQQQLVASGVLKAVSSRRLGLLPYTSYRAEMASIVRASADLRSVAGGWREADARCAALCGLVVVLQVHTELYINQPPGQLGTTLRGVADGHSPLVKDLVALVDTLVGDAAVAVYR